MQLPPNVHDALLEEHRTVAGCCKGNLKADPPQAPMPGGEPCPHTPRCPNCGKNHGAHERACVFWSHRFDQLWHVEKYRQDLLVRILSFNCAKSSLSAETILEHFVLAYDIVFIQEPPWRFVRTAPSTSRKSGDDVIGAPLHLAWLPMVRIPEPDTRPRVMAYVSNRLKEFQPSIHRDLLDHHDMLILSLFANGQSYNLMNTKPIQPLSSLRRRRPHSRPSSTWGVTSTSTLRNGMEAIAAIQELPLNSSILQRN
ncbi:hypothetical protein CVT25_010844 [Psilocybe cyanescens]|uniref:Endonuclease/exonuclease/phosphatase domain-containing protein n=1 Tax=Psilocybe cyanescens TaxID=93625 RepID=A0A409XSZ1_PSICY|nr:hypothetical protein CVT25_010844 [Psilocybe cyanescens]